MKTNQLPSKTEQYYTSIRDVIDVSRTSHWRCSVKKSVAKNFAKFAGKKHVLEPLFDKVGSSQVCNFIKKNKQVISCETCKKFWEHLFSRTSSNDFFRISNKLNRNSILIFLNDLCKFVLKKFVLQKFILTN